MISATRETFEHRPNRSQIAEAEMAGAVGHRRRAGHRCIDVGRLAQVALGDHLGLASHPGDLAQVVVGLALDGLADDRCHVLGHTPSGGQSRASDQDKRAGQRHI